MNELLNSVRNTAARIARSVEAVRQPAARALGYALTAGGSSVWLARIATAGPLNEGDFSDERYWVREIEVLGQTNGKWCVGDKASGRHVIACNLTEMGGADVLDANSGSPVAMSTDNDPCTAFLTSGSGSTEVSGRTYDGFHGVLRVPGRIVFTPDRLVEVRSVRTRGGEPVYYFTSTPSPIIPASYCFDETCLTDGCPDGEHWAGYLTGFAVIDDSAGDDMPECGA